MNLSRVAAALLVLLVAVLPAGAADFTDAVARKMVKEATALVKKGKYLRGPAISSALIGRQFLARQPGSAAVPTFQFYSTGYTVTLGFNSALYDWKVSGNMFCSKLRTATTYVCKHRVVKLTEGTVLVGTAGARSIAMRPRIKV